MILPRNRVLIRLLTYDKKLWLGYGFALHDKTRQFRHICLETAGTGKTGGTRKE